MSTGQGRSETPEPPWVKKFVVGLYCGAAYHDVAFVGHGGRCCLRRCAGAPGAALVVPPRSRRRDARPPIFCGGSSLFRRGT